MKNNKKVRYTVIDNKKSIKSTYTKWQWLLAFALIFIAGIGEGILIYYFFQNI